MKGITYFAVFEPTNSGFSVYFPNLPGCITVGETISECMSNAEEALGLHLWGLEKDNEEIPFPTNPPFDDMDTGCFVMPITVYMDLVRNEMNNKAVKKTLTIPHWLNELAEQNNLNFSQTLQNALREQLNNLNIRC